MIMLMLWACNRYEEPPYVEGCLEPGLPQISLPEDEQVHGEPREWWHWRGHLRDESGQWYGLDQRFLVYQEDGYAATEVHLAISDPRRERFDLLLDSSEELPGPPLEGFSLAVGSQTASGSEGEDQLQGSLSFSAWELRLTSTQEPVLHHGDGYHEDGSGASWHYSRTWMQAEGVLWLDDEAMTVEGPVWFDHQWGELELSPAQARERFFLQLDDGRSVWILREQGQVQSVTLTSEGGESCDLPAELVSVQPAEEWTSPDTGCVYTTRWELDLDGESLELQSSMEEQELYGGSSDYWEGAMTVSGSATGRAFAELTGPCQLSQEG